MSSGWDSSWPYLLRLDLWLMQDVIRMTYNVTLCHPDEIINLIPKSSGWLNYSQYLIRMTYGHCRMSSGWLMANALCHPNDLAGISISSGWVTANSVCHPDDILDHLVSSRWLNWSWYLSWVTAMLLCHPDERYASFLKSSGWDSKFRFFTTRGGPSGLPYSIAVVLNLT